MQKQRWKKVSLFIGIALITLTGQMLSGCSFSSSDKEIDDAIIREAEEAKLTSAKEQQEAERLLQSGMKGYTVGKYYAAIKDFEELLDRYPFSKEAVPAELKAADCSYYMKNYEEAFVRYESFEEKHPSHNAMPYVMFQKAMCYYEQISRVERDSSCAAKAVGLFRQLINTFPDSVYTPQAKEKLRISREFLANHELSVAQFYLRTGKYTQAETRLGYLLANYPETEVAVTADALLRNITQTQIPEKQHTLLGKIFGDDGNGEEK